MQRRLTLTQLAAVRDAIIADTVHLCANEDLHSAIENAMEGSFEAMMQLLRKENYSGCALEWWRKLRSRPEEAVVFSHFFRAARIFLSMPAGGAPSESVFSSTTDMVTKKRNSLSDKTLEQMTIVRHFVRSPRYSFEAMSETMVEAVEKHQGQGNAEEELEEEDDDEYE